MFSVMVHYISKGPSCKLIIIFFNQGQKTCAHKMMHLSKKEGKDQESILSSTIPDPGYQLESNTLTIDIINESQEVSPFPAGDYKA